MGNILIRVVSNYQETDLTKIVNFIFEQTKSLPQRNDLITLNGLIWEVKARNFYTCEKTFRLIVDIKIDIY